LPDAADRSEVRRQSRYRSMRLPPVRLIGRADSFGTVRPAVIIQSPPSSASLTNHLSSQLTNFSTRIDANGAPASSSASFQVLCPVRGGGLESHTSDLRNSAFSNSRSRSSDSTFA
jgi:hypothetical protein